MGLNGTRTEVVCSLANQLNRARGIVDIISVYDVDTVLEALDILKSELESKEEFVEGLDKG